MSGLQSFGCGDEDCFMGNKIWLSDEGGGERINLIWGHHKNSTRTSKPIPAIKLPVGDPLTRVLQWWIKVGFFRLKSGTMVSDDEVTCSCMIVSLPKSCSFLKCFLQSVLQYVATRLVHESCRAVQKPSLSSSTQSPAKLGQASNGESSSVISVKQHVVKECPPT